MLQIIKPELLSLSPEQMQTLMPYFWVFAGSLVILLLGVARKFNPKWIVFLLTLGTCGIAFTSSLGLLRLEPILLFNQMMISDSYSHFFNAVFLASAGFTVLA